MLSRVEEFHGPTPGSLQGLLAIRIGMVALFLAVVWGSDLNAVTRTSVVPQQIGVEQRLEAENVLGTRLLGWTYRWHIRFSFTACLGGVSS